MIVFILITASMIPADGVTHDAVDLLEVNHFYDERWHHVFDQLIFYDWDSGAGRYRVVAWRLLKTAGQQPRRDWSRGFIAIAWQDGDRFRVVTASAVRRTWTQYDPELLERKKLPPKKRRGLTGEKKLGSFPGPPPGGSAHWMALFLRKQ